jgi:regulatory protein
VSRLIELGYLDDERYATAWIASRDRSRPRGSAALRRELGRKGIARELIETVLAERDAPPTGVEPDGGVPNGSADLAAGIRLLERRAPALAREPDPRKRRHRAYALLARNGFDPDVCTRLAAELGSDSQGRGDDP